MRPIKFRAYDKSQFDMIEGILPLSDGTFLLEDANGTNYVRKYPGMDDMPPDTFVIMQFTGVFDQNGKEIYEGDIIKTFIGNCRCDITATGVWFGGLDLISAGLDIEVVGNIYENPELLK